MLRELKAKKQGCCLLLICDKATAEACGICEHGGCGIIPGGTQWMMIIG